MDTFNMDDHMPISAAYVLSQVDDLLIFRHYMGDFKLGKTMHSPLRPDAHPSFKIILNRDWLKLQYKDWTTGEVGDCFKFVARKFGITWNEAVYKVACDFGLVKGCSIVSKKQLQEARDFKEQFQRECLIQVSVRPMSEVELEYWRQFNITPDELKSNHIYAIKHIWVNKNEIFLRPGLHFAYHFPEEDKFKIYSPLEREGKWFGNVSAFTVEGIDAIYPQMGPLVVTKSRKDRIILKKLYPNVINCQNEADTAIPKELDDHFSPFPAKYIWFDTDEPGKTASKKLNYRGYKWINVPNQLYDDLDLKDPGDVVKHFGWEEGSKILLNELNKKLGHF